MNTAQRIDYYQLTRLMWWRYQIELLDAQSQKQIVAVLAPLTEDLKRELSNLTPSQLALSDTRKADLLQWLENATQGAQDAISGTITTAAVQTAETALSVHYGILSVGGAIKNVRTAGLTAQELQAWFQTVPLGKNMLTEWVDRAFEAGVRDSIFTTIQRAGVEGVGTAEQVKRLLSNAVEEGYDLTQREAITLARTYTAQANAAAHNAVMEANDGLIKGWKWRAVTDNKVCAFCSPLDGMTWDKEEQMPPWPRHPNCLTGDNNVFAPDTWGAYIATYSGPVFEFTISSSARFTVTANHMLLTRDGFAPAHSIRKGTQIFYSPHKASGSLGVSDPHNNWHESRIDNKVHALAESSSMRTFRVPASPEHFHGDGEFIKDYIDIIYPASLLDGDFESFFSEFSDKINFNLADLERGILPSESVKYFSLFRLWSAANCRMSGLSVSDVFFLSALGHHESICGGVVSDLNAAMLKDKSNCASEDPDAFSDRVFRFPGIVPSANIGMIKPHPLLFPIKTRINEDCPDSFWRDAESLRKTINTFSEFMGLDYVVNVKESYFSGHVYDLQTFSTLYLVNGAVSSNCRCQKQALFKKLSGLKIDTSALLENTARPWTVREAGAIGAGGKKILNYGTTAENYSGWYQQAMSVQQQEDVFGKARSRLLREGKINLADTIEKSTGMVRTLEEMGFSRDGSRLR